MCPLRVVDVLRNHQGRGTRLAIEPLVAARIGEHRAEILSVSRRRLARPVKRVMQRLRFQRARRVARFIMQQPHFEHVVDARQRLLGIEGLVK